MPLPQQLTCSLLLILLCSEHAYFVLIREPSEHRAFVLGICVLCSDYADVQSMQNFWSEHIALRWEMNF
jgi:hypothetical protein